MAYLARTLDKSDFGIVAISGLLITIIQTVGLSGIADFIIFCNDDDRAKKQNSAFWLNTFLTLIIGLVILISAPIWASMYNDQRIIGIIWLLLIGFIFNMLSSIPIAIFRKNLEYKRMIRTQMTFGTISQLSQIIFVYNGFGVYSLAIPAATIMPVMSVVLFVQSGFKINFKAFGKEYWKEIFSYTKHILGSQILTKLVNEGDTFLVGKFLGLEALGIYDISFKFANLFNQHLLPIVTNISMPLFSNNKEDLQKVKLYYFKMISLIAFVFIPVNIWMVINAKSLIVLIYGNQWTTAVYATQILMFFVIFRTLSSPTSSLYNSLGKPFIGFYFSIIFTPILLFSLFVSSSYGLIEVCYTVSIVRILGSLTHFYLGNKLINSDLMQFFLILKPVLISVCLVSLLIIVLNITNFLISTMVYFSFVYALLRLLSKEYFVQNFSLIIPEGIQKKFKL